MYMNKVKVAEIEKINKSDKKRTVRQKKKKRGRWEGWIMIKKKNLPSPCQCHIKEDSSPSNTTDEAQSNDHYREGHDPVDIFGKKDLTGAVHRVVNLIDDIPGEVRGHGKVGDGADEQGDGEEVVEDPLALGDDRQDGKDQLLYHDEWLVFGWEIYIIYTNLLRRLHEN